MIFKIVSKGEDKGKFLTGEKDLMKFYRIWESNKTWTILPLVYKRWKMTFLKTIIVIIIFFPLKAESYYRQATFIYILAYYSSKKVQYQEEKQNRKKQMLTFQSLYFVCLMTSISSRDRIGWLSHNLWHCFALGSKIL